MRRMQSKVLPDNWLSQVRDFNISTSKLSKIDRIIAAQFKVYVESCGSER